MITPAKLSWKFLLQEPLYYLFLCFFQPERFNQIFEKESTAFSRFGFMLRMILPQFIVLCLPTLFIRSILYFLVPNAYPHYQPILIPFTLSNLLYFLTDTIWAALVAIILSPLVGSALGITTGIAFGLSGGIWAGITVNTEITRPGFLIVLSVILLIDGSIFGSAIGGTRAALSHLGTPTVGSIIGFLIALFIGTPIGLTGGYLGGQLGGVLPTWAKSTASSVLGGIIGSVLSTILILVVNNTLPRSLGQKRFNTTFERALAIGTVFCIAAGGIIGGAAGYFVQPTRSAGFPIFFNSIMQTVIFPDLPALLAGILGFIIGFFRLQFYPFSSIFMFRAYHASQKKPMKVFELLHTSALYWDEGVLLSLPSLKQMLMLAVQQDSNRTLKEVHFIVNERPAQLRQAHAVSLEIALSKLEVCESLEQFSQVSPYLSELLSRDAALLDAHWVPLFAWLADASREATRYYTLITPRSRGEALNDMIIHLNHIHPEKAFNDTFLNDRLSTVVNRWLTLARQELEALDQLQVVVGYIENPYVSGAALKSKNTLFVGRRDLVRHLEQALDRGAHRPTFFLTGERRMGKTSTLNQLSILLSTRYIPIVIDLQARGISANTSAFLATVADAISSAMSARGTRVDSKLEYGYLREVSHENTALAYHAFGEWFRYIEATLKKKELTILLAFDEFEKLEEANTADYLDLALLLDWFRNIMQNHPRIALLFSGVKTLAEMGPNWAGYFVNVKTLHVGLLPPVDAYRLITQPFSGYPGKEFMDDLVIDEIMRVTGNHPFLIQAVCSELVDLLNTDSRSSSELTDVATAVNEVLEGWWATYFRDLWERTSSEQRSCLETLKCLGKATLQEIMQSTALDERTTAQTLQILLRRDLVLHNNGLYSIIAPIFLTWVERNS